MRQEPPSSGKSSSPEEIYEQCVAVLRISSGKWSNQGPQPRKSLADATLLAHCSEQLN